MELDKPKQVNCESTRTNRVNWKTKDYDKEMLFLVLGKIQLFRTANSNAEQVIDNITGACNAAMPRRVHKQRRLPVYWWNREIESACRKYDQTRRLDQRAKKNKTQIGQEAVDARNQKMTDTKSAISRLA